MQPGRPLNAEQAQLGSIKRLALAKRAEIFAGLEQGASVAALAHNLLSDVAEPSAVERQFTLSCRGTGAD